MKKRDSIFSNGSINGFNSALYFASEFNADSDSDTWIPINECCSDLSKSVISNASKFHDDSQPRKYSQKADLQIDLINKTHQSKLVFDKLPAENAKSWKRRFSTPINIQEQNFSNHWTKKDHCSSPIAEEAFSTINENQSTNVTNVTTSQNFTSYQGTSTNLLNLVQSSDSLLHQMPPVVYSPTKISMMNPRIVDYINNQPITMNTMVMMNLMKEQQSKFNKMEPQPRIVQTKESIEKKKGKKKTSQPREGDWICKECQNLNFSFRLSCNKCSYEKQQNEK